MFDMSSETDNPTSNLHGNSNDESSNYKENRRLSRSPHPYALRYPDLLSTSRTASNDHNPWDATPPHHLNNYSSLTHEKGQKPLLDTRNNKSRYGLNESSDGGTEADDESEPFLKGLPAPPPKLQKGLKDGIATGTPSPLLTPSYLDDEKQKAAFEARFKHRTSSGEKTTSIGEKFTARRRAELIRRATETTLFLSVGCIASHKLLATCMPQGSFDHWQRASKMNGTYANDTYAELIFYASIVCGTYLLYPVRLYLHHHLNSTELRRPQHFLQVPAAFDPATLLYPVLLPVFVAASISPGAKATLTINLVLGIAAMPRTIVPAQDSFSGHTSVHYLLTLIPALFVRENTFGSDTAPKHMAADLECLSLLYPLHQVLMPTLGYLTTTSLLPTELQLASISMINLLLLSSSPQALILQAILWIGGLSLFILCKRILQWEVGLARIPTWRFRRDTNRNQFYVNVNRILKDLMKGRLSFTTFAKLDSEDSDSDEPSKITRDRLHSRQRGFSFASSNDKSTLSKTRSGELLDPLLTQPPMKPKQKRSPQPCDTRPSRRTTLPSFIGPYLDGFIPIDARNKVSQFTMPKTFRSLTKDQAAIFKWFYALYTYSVCFVLIAVPIRVYIGRFALQNHEPVGWALGYLFGDIHGFRSAITRLRLGQWIPMPPGGFGALIFHGCAEKIRRQFLGEANTRLVICLHCICTIGIGLTIVFKLREFADVDTRRKVFHGMMVVMFLPTISIDPTFVALALSLVLAIFLLLDLFRASQLPPLSRPLTYFLAPYVDGRDHRGPVIVSHIFLLIGCSIPLWLSLASLPRGGVSPWQGWEVSSRDLSMVSGIICVGMGDAAASLIGRRYGTRRWCWSGGKSLEGSIAFAIAVLVGLTLARLWLLYGGWEGRSGDSWPLFFCKASIAASGASLTEAVLTGGNDNVIVPVNLWLLVRGLAI
ncbi:MAG: hypothetical protein L6R41_000028 [Letrouitia leprolyta]|nr:MAG: hypothetical protein L6R41_000028 [Letrouitia leprolyta]